MGVAVKGGAEEPVVMGQFCMVRLAVVMCT